MLFGLANYLLTPTLNGVTIDAAFKNLSHYQKIEGVLSILNGKCEKEKNFGTKLSAKIMSKHL